MTDFEGNFDLLAPLRDGQEQPELTGGEGARYWTADGRSVVDLNEMRVVLGQNNAAFQEAMEKAFSEFTAPKNGLSPAKTQLLGWLDRTTNGQFAAAHLTSSGSEAVEWAIRLAQKRTGRPEILAFWNSIHGRTYLSASLSALPRRNVGYGPLAPGVAVSYTHLDVYKRQILPPVLILQGTDDWRVIPGQAYEMDRALTAAGKEHKLIIYPGADHSLEGTSFMEDTLAWFQAHPL